MNTHISQNVLETIKKENIKPTARWYFVVKHAVLWVPGIIVTLLGAVAVAGGLYAFNHSGWEYREFVYSSQKDFLFDSVPFVWVASFALFAGLIVKALRTTHSGYKLSAKSILFGSIFLSIILGASFYIIDDTFGVDSIIRYPIHMRDTRVWFSPSEGRLAGVIEKKEAGFLELRDKDNRLWDIDMSGFGTTTFPFVAEGKSIRIVGTSTKDDDTDDTEEHDFIACAVFPWEIGGFPRPPLSPPHMGRQRMIPPHSNNPDCTSVLNDVRQHIRRGERNRL